jgi:hypothetical protein
MVPNTLVLNPRNDREFVSFAEALLAEGPVTPETFESRVRERYPLAVVRPRELASEPFTLFTATGTGGGRYRARSSGVPGGNEPSIPYYPTAVDGSGVFAAASSSGGRSPAIDGCGSSSGSNRWRTSRHVAAMTPRNGTTRNMPTMPPI